MEQTQMMSTRLVYASNGVWVAIVAALMGSAVFTGVHLTMATGAVAALVGLMPLAMMLRWRGEAQPQALPIHHRRRSDGPPFSV
jgi:TRAP-type mannitol/chloroaromatic compound transport system permease large subunit